MATEIGLNLTALTKLPPFVLNLSNTTAEIFTDIPQIADASTNGFLAPIILIPLWFLSFWVLSEKGPLQDFGYDDMRAVCLAFGITSLMGVTLLQVGWIFDLTFVGLTTMLMTLSAIYIWFYENKGGVD